MQGDIRRSSLNNLQHLLKQLDKLRSSPTHKQREHILNSISTSFDLLRNDMILLLNQNFYLTCKLTEKQQALSHLEQKYINLQDKARLSIQMIKIKYEKQIHALRYEQFKVPPKHEGYISKTLAKCFDNDLLYEDLPTPKKTLNLRDTRSALDYKDTLSKPKTFKEEFTDYDDKKIDLEVRLEGVLSQQISKKTPNLLKETAKSDSQEEKYRGGKRGSSEDIRQNQKEKEEQGKKSELARLVAQQFKVPPMKEKYFQTDFL